jgi:ribonuclease BN (tRNA processing enzyme)
MMKLRVLGCSGGIGSNLHTTSLLVDDDILIDAGTGVTTMSTDALCRIDHVFITHSHLDHIACIPLMLDSVARMRSKPLIVHATEATISILKGHVFNWEIWPDFSRVPSADRPFMRYQPISIGKAVNLDGRRITATPATHVVPAVGYHLDSGRGSLVYTGDTTSNDELWEWVNRIENLRYLIIETAFSNREREIAVLSKHLCPSILAEELAKMKRPAEIYITHLKPGEAELTMREIGDSLIGRSAQMLTSGRVFEF